MPRVLLIETDYDLASNISDYLRRDGHEVVWHKDPQAAIETADNVHPEIVVLDLILSTHSGVEFLYELRSYPEWQKLPVIIFSNVSEAELAASHEGLAHLDIAVYHYKPVTRLDELAQSVKLALQLAQI